jgi:hypothetical protein
VNDKTPSTTTPAENEQRRSAALGIAGASGAIGALLVSGWLGEPVRTSIALFVAALGGITAGVVLGNSRDERAHAAGSAVVATIGITFACSAYMNARSSVYNLELLLPMAVGAIPGILAYQALKRLVANPGARAVAALGLAAAALAMALVAAPARPSSSASTASAAPDEAEADAPPARDELISSGERATLDKQFGPKAVTFLDAVVHIDAIVAIHGPRGIAKAGESGQKLLGDLAGGLAAMRAEAGRRIAAGEPATTFATLDAVEQRAHVLLLMNGAAPAR